MFAGAAFMIGGNGGIKVRATDLLCKVETEQEAKDYCAAFMQFYREEAHYLERTAPWVDRVGLASIKQRIVEDEQGRKKLAVFISPFAKEAAEQCVEELANFLHMDPRLPAEDKQYKTVEPIQIVPAWSLQEIIDYL